MNYIIPSNECTPEELAERVRLESLPTCEECGTLIDEANGDERFAEYHVDCFAEIAKRVRIAMEARRTA